MCELNTNQNNLEIRLRELEDKLSNLQVYYSKIPINLPIINHFDILIYIESIEYFTKSNSIDFTRTK